MVPADLEWPLTQISRSRYYSTSNNSKTVQDRVIFTGAIESLSNGAIFYDLEQPLTHFLRSRYTLTLNISYTVKDTAVVTMEVGYKKNRIQAFKWCQFEWSWVTSNPDFKVDITQRQITHNGGAIESRIMVYRIWRHFLWPWTTPVPFFKVTL